MDRARPRVVFLSLVIVISSILDALFTLLHIEEGAIEANPVMHVALLAGVPVFLMVKTVGTGLGVSFLAVHQNFRISWMALHGVALAYVVLLVYHASLFLG